MKGCNKCGNLFSLDQGETCKSCTKREKIKCSKCHRELDKINISHGECFICTQYGSYQNYKESCDRDESRSLPGYGAI